MAIGSCTGTHNNWLRTYRSALSPRPTSPPTTSPFLTCLLTSLRCWRPNGSTIPPFFGLVDVELLLLLRRGAGTEAGTGTARAKSRRARTRRARESKERRLDEYIVKKTAGDLRKEGESKVYQRARRGGTQTKGLPSCDQSATGRRQRASRGHKASYITAGD